jgi:transcriptional regulator with XRE-family HTH domain
VSLGSRLKELRIQRKQSLQEVADAVGVSKAYVWQLERDEDINPSIDVLKRIAIHFNTTITLLVGESGDGSSDQQLMRMFRNLGDLSSTDRDIIEDMIKAFRKRQAPKPDEN